MWERTPEVGIYRQDIEIKKKILDELKPDEKKEKNRWRRDRTELGKSIS